MRSTVKVAAAVLTVGLLATGCSKNDVEAGGATGDDTASDSLCATSGDGPKIGLAYDVGGRGDQSFNDLAAAGTKKVAEEIGATCQEAVAQLDESPAARQERLRTLADAGLDPIVAVGFVYSDDVAVVAKEYPDVKFAVVDGAAEGDNITNLAFNAQEGSFLVGAAAGLKTETNKIGFIGGAPIPGVILPFAAGFQAGVKATNPEATVELKYLSAEGDAKAFANAPGAKVAATALFDGGADIVFHAAGKSGAGLFEAAVEQDHWAIGVDSDQYLVVDAEQQKHILTSSLKKVDVAVYDYVKAFSGDTVKPGFDVYDLKRDGVGYATSGGYVDDIQDQLDDYKAKIISGEITVPDAP